MKFLVIIPLVMLNLFGDELSWVNEQIEAIKPQRVGVKDSEITKLKDPIIFLNYKDTKVVKKSSSKIVKKSTTKRYIKKSYKPKKVTKSVSKKSSVRFNLEAIMNRSVLINGEWYAQGDKIGGYKIVEVHNTFVILNKKSKNIMLSTSTKNRTVKFKNR